MKARILEEIKCDFKKVLTLLWWLDLKRLLKTSFCFGPSQTSTYLDIGESEDAITMKLKLFEVAFDFFSMINVTQIQLKELVSLED